MATQRPVTLPVLAPEAKGGSFVPAIAADVTGMTACPRFSRLLKFVVALAWS